MSTPTITWTQDPTTKNHIGITSTGERFIIEKTPGKRYNVYDVSESPMTLISKNAPTLPAAKQVAEATAVTPTPTTLVSEATVPNTAPRSTEDLKTVASGARIVGEVIAWTPGAGTRTHHAVVAAMTRAGLDAKAARDILPRNAFNRACSLLEKNRVIDAVPEQNIGDIFAYQFSTKRAVASSTDFQLSKEWVYDTEAIVHVDKDTGKVWCKDDNLREKVQTLVDEAVVNRTASDITRIVQKLFDTHADLFPIREQGGAYFVPFEHLAFVSQVESFLAALGGRVSRFPVAEPNSSNKSVAEAVSEGLASIIQDHEAAVAEFGFSTHDATLKAAADKIRDTRVKIEAYASYLSDKKGVLLASIDEAKAKLLQKIKDITENKPEVTPSTDKSPRDAFGNKIGSVGHRVLSVVATCETAINMKGIMEDAGLDTTCYNLMKEMTDRGFVEQIQRCYRLTEKGKKLYNPALFS